MQRRLPRDTFFDVRDLVALVCAFLATVSVQAQPAQQSDPPAPAVNLDFDFRGKKDVPPEFYLAGAVHDLTTHPEEEGLRLSLSGTKPNPIGRAGLESKLVLRGDFSITAGYEILQAAPPTQGNGVGFELYAHTVHEPQQGFGVYRMSRVNEGEVYLVSRAYLHADGKRGWRNKNVPTTARAGQLRIVRSGTEVTAWVAEGQSSRFDEIGRDDLGTDDITVIWLMAYTGHVSHAIDLRLTHLSIRSGAIIAPPPAPPIAGPAAAPPRRFLWWVLALLLILLLGAACAWRFSRHRAVRDS
jgi:hypothetical protein